MKGRRTISLALSVLAAALWMGGCAATRVTSTWKDDSYTGGPLTRVMVVGLSDKEPTRRIFEDAFVREFASVGIEAIPSYRVLSKTDTPEAMRSAARKLSVHHLLVTHLVGSEKKEIYHPPVSAPISNSYYGTYGQYYSTVYHYVNEPGYYQTYELVRLESNLYEVETEKLLWTAATETVDPDDTAKDAKDLCRVLVQTLKKAGFTK